ncbi:S9 family peptidase [Chitinophaga sp. sic0106]|uniref:S9 family peptidase n=1 Tax=Chitinophaga sp. sic0106 TaxID=2854785 RepID=UPI001C44EB4F|nr:S9 family peptidase [Chitinophaga sp. sic0106]MBV7529225.1 S9 family peptidase [Chitinophaga sp. sic0106]
MQILRNGFMAAGMLISVSTMAQQRDHDYVRPLPTLVEWTDNQHFILSQTNEKYRTTYLKVDAATGKETIDSTYRPRPKPVQKKLVVRDNDIFLQHGNNRKQLTHDSIPEATPVFSPDSSRIAFTRQHDLYTLELSTGKETRLTFDGTATLMNGMSSWVYMEEILGRQYEGQAFWWSPDSKSIAYFQTDDSKVPEYTITDAGTGYHGYVEKQRYPQPGDANPSVKIGIISATGGNTTWADFNPAVDQYFGTPVWSPDNKSLLVQWVNRDQNHYQLQAVNPSNGSKVLLYDETQPTWISLDEEDRITFVNGGKQFIFVSDKSGHRHLYLHNADGTLKNQLTSGNFEVNDIQYIDEQKKVIYLSCNKDGLNRQDLYRVDFNGKNFQRLTFGPYNHEVKFSPDAKYFTTKYSNTATPDRLALVTTTGKIVKELADSKGPAFNEEVAARRRTVYVKSEDGKFELPINYSLPRNFTPGKKYPLILVIYGGPGSSNVYDRFVNPKFTSGEEIIHASIDHRGCGEFGKAGQNYMYRNLGYQALQDYIHGLKWLIANVPVDTEKVCISGYSFGGYMTCYALTYGADYFKYGIAGGSVVDWRMYDSHYTERYMDTPADNPEGYEKSSVLTYTHKLKGRLLLMHGVKDDNVHINNTLSLVDKLERDNNQHFELMVYPGNRHGVISEKLSHYNEVMNLFQKKYLLNLTDDKK